MFLIQCVSQSMCVSQSVCVFQCVFLSQLLVLLQTVAVLWDLVLLSGSSPSSLADVCVVAGRLSGIFAANWAALARLCVSETAGMCSVPPGRGMIGEKGGGAAEGV